MHLCHGVRHCDWHNVDTLGTPPDCMLWVAATQLQADGQSKGTLQRSVTQEGHQTKDAVNSRRRGQQEVA